MKKREKKRKIEKEESPKKSKECYKMISVKQMQREMNAAINQMKKDVENQQRINTAIISHMAKDIEHLQKTNAETVAQMEKDIQQQQKTNAAAISQVGKDIQQQKKVKQTNRKKLANLGRALQKILKKSEKG